MDSKLRQSQAARAGFTLIELLVVIGIIVILIGILIPTVSRVRRSAQTASVKAELAELGGAIDRFYQDQGTYPGPLPSSAIDTADRAAGNPMTIGTASGPTLDTKHITQSENLVLGLLGGLTWNSTGQLVYDPAMVGQGMVSITSPNNFKKYQPYLSKDSKILSNGQYSDGAGAANDTVIPEFLDKYPNPMPILYLRANKGASGVVSIDGKNVDGNAQITQYDLCDILAYTKGQSGSIGEGKSISPSEYFTAGAASPPSMGTLPHGLQTVTSTASMHKGDAGYTYPYDAFPYFVSPSVAPTIAAQPNATGTARSKDTYILISAGPDRVYGTADDVCSFGSLTE